MQNNNKAALWLQKVALGVILTLMLKNIISKNFRRIDYGNGC